MTPQRRLRLDLAQLLRLRLLREDAARAERDRRARELQAAQDVVAAREREIEGLKADIAALAAWIVGEGAARMATLGGFAAARRAMFDDRLERAEYALIDDEEALEQCERALAVAQAQRLRAGRRRQAVEQLIDRHRRERGRLAEQRLERETEPATRGLHAGVFA